MKDNDVTWLYGPFVQSTSTSLDHASNSGTRQIPGCSSVDFQKSILKRRSLSENMLRRSLSSSTLMKQVTDTIGAQHQEKEIVDHLYGNLLAIPEKVDFPVARKRVKSRYSGNSHSMFESERGTLYNERRIRFNDKVEQFIAVNQEEDNKERTDTADDAATAEISFVGKPARTALILSDPSRTVGSKLRKYCDKDITTIAILPWTTLDSRMDSPELLEQKAQKQQYGGNPESNFPLTSLEQNFEIHEFPMNSLVQEDDDDVEFDWQPPTSPGDREEDMSASQLQASGSSTSARHQIERASPSLLDSGPFSPYEGYVEREAMGLLDKIADVVNTAKDIACVLWNVGWRD